MTIVPVVGQLAAGFVSSISSSASCGNFVYCPIRSIETILFSKLQNIQAATKSDPLRFIPYVKDNPTSSAVTSQPKAEVSNVDHDIAVARRAYTGELGKYYDNLYSKNESSEREHNELGIGMECNNPPGLMKPNGRATSTKLEIQRMNIPISSILNPTHSVAA